MPTTPVNHAPLPVLEGVSPNILTDVDCEKIKAEFGVETNTHKANRSGDTKKTSREYQSHHILQDAQTNSLIGRDDARAIMLADSHRGTEHGIITARQNARKHNKKNGSGGATPASNMGDLKKQAKGDLMYGLEERRKEKGKTSEELEVLADCLVAEATKAIDKETKKSKKKKKVTDETKVKQPGECLPASTPIWLESENRISAGAIAVGQTLSTGDGQMTVIRTDYCRSNIIELGISGKSVFMAPFHRVQTEDGSLARADDLWVGARVATAKGVDTVTYMKIHPEVVKVYSFGVGRASIFHVGSMGLCVDLPDIGPAVVREETVFQLSDLEVR
ncbi:MAG: hypothetical protein JXX14_13760 [Deltaproteobacteria bacterium]|nr:hypothetical protein [Deltaproteobacteria bacterium]